MSSIKQVMIGIEDNFGKLHETDLVEHKIRVLDVLRTELDLCLKEISIVEGIIKDAEMIESETDLEYALQLLPARIHFAEQLKGAITEIM